MQVVRGHLQAYDWGPQDGLRDWTASTGGPQAELWFGTHPNGTSPLRDGAGAAAGPLPVLLKVLAAARPLSIQIHPSALLAQKRFAEQQADPDGEQLLSDPHGKAELLIALEPFVILEGFRDPLRTAAALAEVPEAGPVCAALLRRDLPGAVRAALALPTDVVARRAPDVPAAFERAGLTGDDAAAMREVVACYPDDPGVFVAALLTARTLAPGEAVYVDAGTVHAYVRGLGLEVMTSSDNVLRLGLTSKRVAVDAALEALDVAAQPQTCDPVRQGGVRTYAPVGAPFAVDDVQDARVTAPSGSARIILCLRGTTTVGDQRLRPGEAALLDATSGDVDVVADGRAVIARDTDDSGRG